MKSILILVLAFVLLIPISAVAQLEFLGERAALGTDDSEYFMIIQFGQFLLGALFIFSPIIAIIIMVLIIKKLRKNTEDKTKTIEELRKEKTTRGKIWLISSSMFWLVFLFAITQDIHGFGFYDNGVPPLAVLTIVVVFPFIAIILTIIGYIKLVTRNTLSKNETIQQLADRLDKLESDKEQDSEEK